MENHITTEATQLQTLKKRIHRARLVIDIVLWSMFGLVVFIGLNVFASGRYEQCTEAELSPVITLSITLLVILLAGLGLREYLSGCYQQYRCTVCGHVHDLETVTLDDSAIVCPICNKKTKHKKVPFQDDKATEITNKAKRYAVKPWVIVVACLFAVGLFIMSGDPIVLTIKHKDHTSYVGNHDDNVVFSFYTDEDGIRYYLADGCMDDAVTVIYLNRSPETLHNALAEGHITINDLDHHNIEYLTRDTNW